MSTKRELEDRIIVLETHRLLLARLCAETPQFSNPIQVWAIQKLRDELLAGENP